MTGDDPLNFIEPRVAAGALFLDEQGRILMVVPTYKDYWDIPGGYVENGETPTEAVRREVKEEIDITPPIGRLLVADWWSDSPENNGRAKLLLVFDGGVISDSQLREIQVDSSEIERIDLLDIENVDNVTIPRLANRLRHTIDAKRNGRPLYLECGINHFSQIDNLT